MTTVSPSNTVTVPILLFARYAELLGTARLELALPRDATVASAITALRSQPGGAALPTRLLVARNLVQVTEDAVLSPGDELAVLPPLSGG